jgi:hypothetical protein
VTTVSRHAFDGADLTFFVDVRSALERANVKSGESPSLEAKATFSCPKQTFEDVTSAESATVASRSPAGRAIWIFPFNFFLVEELAILGDSIEALVEAADSLQITLTGDDGSEEFLYEGFGDGSEHSTLFSLARDEDIVRDDLFGGLLSGIAGMMGALQNAQTTALSV